MGKYQNVYDDVSVALGTLAANTSTGQTLKTDGSRLQGFRVMRMELTVDYYNFAAAEGPLAVYVCGDLTVAEADEAIDADPQRADDPGSAEQANRPLWLVGMIPMQTGSAGGGQLNNGKPIVINPKWSIPEGSGLNFRIRNLEGSALTTGCVVHAFIKTSGVWLDD